MATFSKLNSMGHVVQQPQNMPSVNKNMKATPPQGEEPPVNPSARELKEQNEDYQIINVTYGHNPSGKTYSYIGKKNRAGDVVTPKVTHRKTGEEYTTLGVVSHTHGMNKNGQATIDGLNAEGIKLKYLEPTDRYQLPGFIERQKKDPMFTAQKWHDNSVVDYNERLMKRRTPLGKIK